ncbi:MAG: TIGR03936 family radical SAM-associated protein, partial [Desulfovibrionaceae bacterium]
HVQKLLQHGWQQVKLYFMIGLPTETQADLDAIVAMCVKVRDAAGRGGPRLQVTAAISPFVPKPFTPFQWEEQISLDEITRRINYLRTAFKSVKGMKMRWHEPAMSHLEGILSRADRNLAPVIESAYRKGAIFCSWMEGFSLAPWLEAMDEHGLSVDAYTGQRTVGAPLPWDHLNAGIDPHFLRRERERALKEKITADCRYHACRQCGACDTKGRPSRLPRVKFEDTFSTRLNFAQRDQEAHQPKRDEQGRIVCPVKSAAPPQIAPELGIKAVQFRVWHTKEDGAAFLSQLELQAVLERALRRAALPMSFSQGFHPLPLMSFGRALPVGVVSQAEWFAITLRQPLSAEQVQERLSPHLPKGMRLLRVDFVNTAGRTAQAKREHFTVCHIGAPEEQARFAAQWQHFATLDTWVWTRETKKGERSTDVRALLAHIDIHTDHSVDFIANWDAGYLSPQAIVLAVTGQDQLPYLRLVKTAQDFAD